MLKKNPSESKRSTHQERGFSYVYLRTLIARRHWFRSTMTQRHQKHAGKNSVRATEVPPSIEASLGVRQGVDSQVLVRLQIADPKCQNEHSESSHLEKGFSWIVLEDVDHRFPSTVKLATPDKTNKQKELLKSTHLEGRFSWILLKDIDHRFPSTK
jgi:hypothetical protein